jgi:uncharacterized protein
MMRLINKKKKRNVKIRFLEDSLLISNKILVFSDLHLGYEESLKEFGHLFGFSFKEVIEKMIRISDLLDRLGVKLEKIIILGDLKHEFSNNLNSEWRESLMFLDFIKKKCKEVIIVKGNHDNYLVNILEKRKIKIYDKYVYRNIGFLHGDKEDEEVLKCRTIVLGHLHPAITLSDEYKREKYKCFLVGRLNRQAVYILPSFSPVSIGYELLEKRIKSGIKKDFRFIINDKGLSDFEVIIYNNKDNKEYNFGKLGRLI